MSQPSEMSTLIHNIKSIRFQISEINRLSLMNKNGIANNISEPSWNVWNKHCVEKEANEIKMKKDDYQIGHLSSLPIFLRCDSVEASVMALVFCDELMFRPGCALLLAMILSSPFFHGKTGKFFSHLNGLVFEFGIHTRRGGKILT